MTNSALALESKRPPRAFLEFRWTTSRAPDNNGQWMLSAKGHGVTAGYRGGFFMERSSLNGLSFLNPRDDPGQSVFGMPPLEHEKVLNDGASGFACVEGMLNAFGYRLQRIPSGCKHVIRYHVTRKD